MKRLIFILSVFAVAFSVQNLKAQTQFNTAKETTETIHLQKRAETALAQIDWVTKMQNIDEKKLENLEKWHQFPITKAILKQEASISRQNVRALLETWYNEKPVERAKIILSFE